jgi:hypothetical protein
MAGLEAILEDFDCLLVLRPLFAQPFNQAFLLQHHLGHVIMQ